MSESANTRNLKTLVLQRVAITGQKAIAARILATISRVSRFFSGNGGLTLDETLAAIDEVGLKLVDKDEITISKEEYEALKLLARKALG